MKWLFLLALCLPMFARADFQKRCHEHHANLPSLPWKPRGLAVGQIFHLPTREILATQRRFSHRVVNENIAENRVEKEIEVVIWNDRAYTLDGHHQLVTNVMLDRAETLAKVVHNFTGLTESAFKETMKTLSYIEDEAHGPDALHPCDMRNDPYLYLVRQLIVRAKVDEATGEVTMGRGSSQPLAVKINGGPTYAELRMAADLAEAGIKYKPKWGESFKGGITRKIRRVLAKSEWMREQTHIMVLPKRMNARDEHLPGMILDFWQRKAGVSCATHVGPLTPKALGEGH